MAKKRQLVYQGHSQEVRCLWCGQMTTEHRYIVNPGGEPEMKCCCEDCFEHTQKFIKTDNRIKPFYYVVLLAFIFANLFVIGTEWYGEWWSYLPLFGICFTVFLWPSVFKRYEHFHYFGIKKSFAIFRAISGLIALVAIVNVISRLL